MKRFTKILAAAALVVLLVAAVTVYVMRQTAKAWPPAYRQALAAADNAALEAGKQLFESRVAAFYSESQSAETWGIELPLSAINAWLATRLDEELPRLESEAAVKLRAPRVWIEGDRFVMAAQTTVGPIDSVLSIGLRPTVTDRGELALEFTDTRVGNLPVPASGVAEHLRRSFVEESIPLRWAGSESRTLAMLDPGRTPLGEDRPWRFTHLELTEGKLRVACAAEQETDPKENASTEPNDE
ncbi:hypothetical protein [Botrimarina hoheduenensis]|uniref:DUF2993 domain-containing protein n=1 Tax=Botrimarina hoheduenensis TaxID=2528000 RepID=A0A5C5WC40_9BACT|nr:hypothetical protein [Botrimarina hoheduenensis]TWT48476.1 hypothetical protein Pla111_02440 [Botrimarina hoheduenensis]